MSVKTHNKTKLVPVNRSVALLPERDASISPILECIDLGVTFGGLKAVDNFDITIGRTEIAGLIGPNGAGKTTIFNLLTKVYQPTHGTILLDGKDISAIRENQLAAFRRDQLGFVFQDFNLLDTFSLKDNILLPLVLQGMNWREMEANLLPIANQLRIANLLEKYPYEVSGGQKQRAAVCRALITHPRLILADEPTGALDSRATDALLDVFQQINQTGQTLLMVTHSLKAASRAGRILFIRDGQVYHQLYRGEMTNEQFYEKISDALTVMTRKDAMDGEMA